MVLQQQLSWTLDLSILDESRASLIASNNNFSASTRISYALATFSNIGGAMRFFFSSLLLFFVMSIQMKENEEIKIQTSDDTQAQVEGQIKTSTCSNQDTGLG
jgi:hypothetical protein